MATATYDLPTLAPESPVNLLNDFNALANGVDEVLGNNETIANDAKNTANAANATANAANATANAANATANAANATANAANATANDGWSSFNLQWIRSSLENDLGLFSFNFSLQIPKLVADNYAKKPKVNRNKLGGFAYASNKKGVENVLDALETGIPILGEAYEMLDWTAVEGKTINNPPLTIAQLWDSNSVSSTKTDLNAFPKTITLNFKVDVQQGVPTLSCKALPKPTINNDNAVMVINLGFNEDAA